MMHTARASTWLTAATTVLVAALLVPSTASALSKPELKCRKAIAKASRGYLRGVLRARQTCQLGIMKGRLSPLTACLDGSGDPDTSENLSRADSQLSAALPRACLSVDLTTLGFPGICRDLTGDGFTVLDLEGCIRDFVNEHALDLLAFEYPEIGGEVDRPDRNCIHHVGRRSAQMVVRDLRARQKCLAKMEQFPFAPPVTCRELPAPEGPGTGDDNVDSSILKAYVRVLAGIPDGCRVANVGAIGFDDDCPDMTGAPFSVFDLKTCEFDVHRASVRSMLEISFPSPPECGNGVVEDVEECDDGNTSNNDGCTNDCLLATCGDGFVCSAPDCTTGPNGGPEICDDGNTSETDSCLNSCEAARCGDGLVCSAPGCTTGPNGGPEACDDNNTIDSDGCLTTCAAATCGDGIVHLGVEDCDDGNTNNNDSCLNSCIIAVCGDGVTCSAAGCSTGPNGGPEACDDGNSSNTDVCLTNCARFTCGDGYVFPGTEECDDGNVANGDGCSSTCQIEGFCGDGNVGVGEECDDGNTIDGDACTNACKNAACGDGIVCSDAACTSGPGGGPEACDDGNTSDTDACLTTCAAATCGDGFVQAGVEACDDGNTSNTDACVAGCVAAVCGDGFVRAGVEACDDGNTTDTDTCTDACTVASCGDGIVCSDASCTSGPAGGPEICDDGANNGGGDGLCLSDCSATQVCGDGTVAGTEQCDDGNTIDTDACPTNCRDAVCGDGFVQAGVEECDDGNTSNTDACVAGCVAATCGDGFTEAGVEGCDDGNLTNGDGCSSTCTVEAVCGDGTVTAPETCDDGNLIDGDGCDSNCTPTGCGNGIVTAGEECDDGNLIDGDGCTPLCAIGQSPQCPNVGILRLWAKTGVPCTDDTPCGPGTCDLAVGRCRTNSDLDTGWTGISHNADIIDDVLIAGTLLCPGPADPTCGECTVTGIDPRTGNCRCSNDHRTICDEPFVADANDCGGSICNCYFGPPLALSSGNTPACVVNRFRANPTGDVNVDLGAGQITANLASVVYLGIDKFLPCPVCGGTCQAPAGSANRPCTRDSDCDTTLGDGTGVCGGFDSVAGDGVREGRCFGSGSLDEGLPCDVSGFNSTFPAYEVSLGGGYSLDCFPAVGKNISGIGLKIDLAQTTGTVSLAANVDCGPPSSFPPLFPHNCPCRVCSGDTTVPCNANSDCSALGKGTCSTNSGAGVSPAPNYCSKEPANGGDLFVGVCNDIGNGEGECLTAADDLFFCDGIVRASGEGFLGCDPTPKCEDTFATCTSNADCSSGFACVTDLDCRTAQAGLPSGDCTLSSRKPCFLDPIVATGQPDPTSPLGVATFCIPPTSNPGINGVAGLPGPGRVKTQATTELFCANAPAVHYVPGVGGCP